MTKKASKKASEVEVDEVVSALEAYAPQAVKLVGEDFLIRGCDGDHEYVWLALKRKATYKVVEVYPGLKASETNIREAESADDLILSGRFSDLSDILEELSEALFADFDFGNTAAGESAGESEAAAN
jgi:hypothetical protein